MVLKYVLCLCKECDGCCVFYCLGRRGAVSLRVWEVWVLRHADVVCLCLVCISLLMQGIMEEACSSRSLQNNKTKSPSKVVG